MICPKCFAEIADCSVFCDVCGTVFEIPDPNAGPESAQQNAPYSSQDTYQQPDPYGSQTPYQGNAPYTGQNQPQYQQFDPYGNPNPYQANDPYAGSSGYQQNPYSNPNPYGMDSGNGGGSGKKLPPVAIGLIITSGVLLIAGVVLLIVLLGKSDDSADVASGGAVAVESREPEMTPETEPTEEPSQATEEPEITPEPEPTTEPEPTEDPGGWDTTDINGLSDEDARAHAADISTDTRPNVGDFNWFYDLYYSDNPSQAIERFFDKENAIRITNPLLLEGDWKAYMNGDPDAYHEEGDRFLNVNIKNNLQKTKATIKFDWWITHDENGDEHNEEGFQTERIGKWNADYTELKEANIEFTKFIEHDEIQYAYGLYHWESGEQDIIVMVRPAG